MFPTIRKHGSDQLYPISLSDEEIDVINSGDEEDMMHAATDESFPHQSEVYIDDVIYDEESMQYEEYIEEQQYEPNQQYPVSENQQFIDAHYINTDEDYLSGKEHETYYQLFKNPDRIERISEEKRLEMYPEMEHLPVMRRPSRLHLAKDAPMPYDSKVNKVVDPASSAVNSLLAANKIYPVMRTIKPEQKNERTTLQDTVTYLSQPRLSISKPPTKVIVPLRKPHRPRVQFPEPKNAHLVPIHQLTPLPDRYFQRRLTITAEQAGFASECKECNYCNFVFRQETLLKTHLKQHETTNLSEVKSETSGLVCPVQNCTIRCDSIATVVKHMQIVHSINDLAFERIVFKNLQEFKMWRTELERLTMARFSRSSGKQNIFSKSTYYHCHYSGHTPSSKLDYRKQRCRASKKLGKTCTAFFHVRENDDGSVLLRGCTKHSGHRRDVRQLPLTEEMKLEISNLLISGMDEISIVDKMREDYPASDRRYYLQNYEVRNVAIKIEKYKEDYKRKLQAGEPVPQLSEIIGGKNARDRPIFPIVKAKLACSRFPVVDDPVPEEYNPDMDDQMEEYSYQDQDDDELEQNYEEVIEDDGLFHIPTAPSSDMFEGRMTICTSPKKDAFQNLLEMPNKIKGRRREKIDVDYEEPSPQKTVGDELNDIHVSSPVGRNTARKNAAKRRKIDPTSIHYADDDGDNDDDDYEESETAPNNSDVALTPTRFSSRLLQKKASVLRDIVDE